MRKMFYRSNLFALIACMLLSLILPVNADDYIGQPGDYLGTEHDNTGYIIQDGEEQGKTRVIDDPELLLETEAGSSLTKIFSIKAVEVNELLVSNKGEKSFTKSSIPSTAKTIVCMGILYHSLEGQVYASIPLMYGGICYYGYSDLYDEEVYISICPIAAESGEIAYGTLSISGNILSNETYYSYVKNAYPSGYLYGTWIIYYTNYTEEELEANG